MEGATSCPEPMSRICGFAVAACLQQSPVRVTCDMQRAPSALSLGLTQGSSFGSNKLYETDSEAHSCGEDDSDWEGEHERSSPPHAIDIIQK